MSAADEACRQIVQSAIGQRSVARLSSAQADDKARAMIECIRCAKINFENLERMMEPITLPPHYRIAKHQLDCAVAIADGEPEPDLVP